MVTVETCEPVFDYMRKSIDLDADTMQLVAANLNMVSFPPKHLLLQEGHLCNRTYFVISGTARSYYTDGSGVTVTWAFHFNNKKSITRNLFVTDYRAFLTNRPASLSIETLSEATFLVFTKEKVNYLMQNSPVYETFMRKLDENAYLGMFDRAFTLLTMSATERYKKLVDEESHLMQLFPNHYIASYLGIAPQSLSRIRTHH